MFRTALSIFLLLYATYCQAQQRLADSLSAAISSYPQQDSAKLHMMNELAFVYATLDPHAGLLIADKAIALAQSLNIPSQLAAAYSRKGVNYETMGEDSLALSMYHRALSIHEQSGNESYMARVLHNIGLVYFGMSDYRKAIDYHTRSFNLFTRTGETGRIAHSLNSLGVNYLYLPDYPKALEHYLQALRIFESAENDSSGMADAVNNVGLTYKNQGDYNNALAYYARALDIYRNLGNNIGEARVLGNMGNIYEARAMPSEALKYFKQALAINQKIGYKRGVASDLANIGIVHAGQRNYDDALLHLEKALNAYQLLEDKNSLSAVLSQMGSVYTNCPGDMLLLRGIKPAERHNVALRFYTRALNHAQQAGSLDRQYEIWEKISNSYQQQRKYDKALHAFQQFTTLRDSVHSIANAREITRKSMQYEFDKQAVLTQAEHDRKTQLAKADLERQRLIKNMSMAGAAFLLISAVGGTVLYKRRRDAEVQKQEAEFHALVADTEMKALRAQMNPHFIFNSLSAISDYMLKNNARLADIYLNKFAKLMRRVLENSERREISVADDLEALELYIQLEALRMNHSFTYEFIVDKDIDTENTLIPPLLMQPFVENSIRHGLTRKEGTGKIIIRISKEDGMLNCSIQDNGIGRKRAEVMPNDTKLANRQSMGIRITQSRIQILNHTKKAPAVMRFEDLAEGTHVEIKLPLALNF